MLWGLSTPTAVWAGTLHERPLPECGRQKDVGVCDDYIAMEGGNYDFDKIYSKGDSYSNIRFRVTDEQDKVEFSNVSDGDTFCYSTVYVDKTFVCLPCEGPSRAG